MNEIFLGCMGFGDAQSGMHNWTLNKQESIQIIRYAIDRGIRKFDTAPVYSNGTSELFLGEAINNYIDRKEVFIATKFMPRNEEERKIYSAKNWIDKNIKESLERLKTDYIDLYIMHKWDENTPIKETLSILHEYVQKGIIKQIGISNAYAYQVAYANTIASYEKLTPFTSIQGHYNLLFREEEREMIPYAKEANMMITPYSSLASGRLARYHETSNRLEKDVYAKGKYDATEEIDNPIIERVYKLSKLNLVSMSEIAIAWLINKGCIPICGATKLSQIDSLVKAKDLQLTKEECDYLEELYKPHELVGMMKKNR